MNIKSIVLRAQLKIDGEIAISLYGRCMAPLLVAGDKVKIVRSIQYSTGHLYLFELDDGRLLVHRMICCENKYAVMKGDRSKRFETIPHGNIIGEVSAVMFSGYHEWFDIGYNKLETYIITFLSEKRMYSYRMKKSLLKKWIKRFQSNVLGFMAMCIRKRWIKIANNK